MTQQPAIQTHHLSIGYRLKGGRRKVLHNNLNLWLKQGEVTCLLGLNGTGKSTLLKTLAGFLPPLGGDVCLLGKQLETYSQTAISRTVGVVLTEKIFAGGISVYELVSLGRHPYTGFFGVLTGHDRAIIEQSLEAAGIAHKAQSYVSELSDGERQKAMISKALSQMCPVIVLDEPTAFLDVSSRIETMQLLRQLAKVQQKAILLSTHDLELAIQMGDTLWLMGENRPLSSGTPEDLILSEQIRGYFEKKDLVFDLSTGKLNASATLAPIGVAGDPLTSCWVGNALLRNGWQPVSVKAGQMNIDCVNKGLIILSAPDGRRIETNNVEGLITALKEMKR